MSHTLLSRVTRRAGDRIAASHALPSTGGPAGLLREAAATAAAGLLVAAFCALLLLHDPGFFWHDDFQSYQLAGFRDIARSWAAGEFPLLSPYSWHGSALAAEYQYGVFSVFLTGCVLAVFALGLPLPLAAAALSVIHLVVLATGAFRLGRQRGLPVELALVVALVAALNGWIIVWGAKAWFPTLASFAWLPWVWWALHRACDAPGGAARFLPAGGFLYLLIAAGWPFTVLMAGVLSLWFALRVRAQQGRWRAAWPVAAAWTLGLGLSAPAWLMVIEYSRHTLRGQVPAFELNPFWVVPALSLPGLALPALVTTWNVFGAPKPHRCLELSGGLVPLAAFLAVSCHAGRGFVRRFRWELGLCLLPLVLALNPGLGNFRWSFRWLPLFFLAAAMLGAHALALLHARPAAGPVEPRPNPGTWATFLVLLAWALAWALNTDPTAHTLWHGATLTAVCLLWATADRRCAPGPFARGWVPAAVVLMGAGLTCADMDRSLEVPAWELGPPPPLDPAVYYLSVHTRADAFTDRPDRPLRSYTGAGADLLPGNFSMYAGFRLVNGYSPMKPQGLSEVFGFGSHGFLGVDAALFDETTEVPGLASARHLLRREAGPDGLLGQMAVDGLIVADQFAADAAGLEAAGWRPAARVAGGQVFHRRGPPSPRVRAVEHAMRTGDRSTAAGLLRRREEPACPWVLFAPEAGPVAEPLAFAPAAVVPQWESRNAAAVDVTVPPSGADSLIAFARPWFPGYRAEFNGRPVAVEVVNLTMPTVRLPAGSAGTLVLMYRPRSLVVGCWIAGASCAAALALAIFAAGRRLRKEAPC